MYRTQYHLFQQEAIYIAGPECFYTNGFDQLAAMKAHAEAVGYRVTLPNDRSLDHENPDLQKRADSIMANLAESMNETTVIISDLEAFRGIGADSGTIFEIGMAYAKGARSYAYTRDKRSLAAKNSTSVLKNGLVYDINGRRMPYQCLPFSPNIIGSTKIVEGDFYDCLAMLSVDLEEEQKAVVLACCESDQTGSVPETSEEFKRPLLFLSGVERFNRDSAQLLDRMKHICSNYGFDAVSCLDRAEEERAGEEPAPTPEEDINPYQWAAKLLKRSQSHIRRCDIVIADLNPDQGYEINNDVAFECGMGYQLGKKLYGYMEDTAPLIHKIPHYGEEKGYIDQTGSKVENFHYPANLMFSCTMEIVEGAFESAVAKAAADYANGRKQDEHTT